MTSTLDRALISSERTRSDLLRFFALSFAASWIFGGLGFIVLDLGVAGLAMGTASITVVALLLTKRTQGSVRPLVRQVLRWRAGIRWYVAAFGAPVVALGLAASVAWLLGIEGLGAASMGLGLALLLLPMQVAIGGLEEPGGRGYALPRLQRGRSALSATLLWVRGRYWP